MTPYVETWTVRKPAIESAAGGLVATHHYEASDIGARVLGDGGNAVDAAVASALAIGAVEPWMSGIGGGGYMLVYSAESGRVETIDFGMVAPRALAVSDYELESGQDTDLFAWPKVTDQRNIHGPYAMAVPGQVAGLALALERYGTRSWADSLSPAIDLAERGLTVSWYTTLRIAAAARELTHYDEARRTYLPDGMPPVGDWEGKLPKIRLGELANTLRRLAKAGPEDFYRGEIAARIAADSAALGGKLSSDDLADYAARCVPAKVLHYRDARVHVPAGLTGGPTVLRALASLANRLRPQAQPDAAAYLAYARSLRDAYAHRLEALGEADGDEDACTTHLSTVDRHGNLVALTQTLLSPFGSKVMLPSTGILMNNGIMWFDPRPGRPNSLAPGRRPLSNMCPIIAECAQGLRAAGGAAGGRRIMSAMFQLASFLIDYGMSLDDALHHARIDYVPSDVLVVDERLPADVQSALADEFEVRAIPNGVYPTHFALPNLVAHHAGDARQSGACFIMSPVAKVSAADQT